MLTKEQYNERQDILKGSSAITIWENIHPDALCGKITLDFDGEKEVFLWFIQQLIEEGKIKLAKRGKFLTGTIQEQMNLFRENFPNNQEEMEDGAFDGYWFLSEKCPAGIVWIHDSGYQDWT